MEQIDDFADDRDNTVWCIHCGGEMAELNANWDHVPSRSLLLKPYPENPPKVRICKSCNAGFSIDEEYLSAILAAVLAGTTEPDRHSNRRAERALRRSPKLRERIERARTEIETEDGETRAIWQPEWNRVQRVVVKNARGHVYFEHGETLLDDPTDVWAAPLETLSDSERDTFETIESGGLWPEVGSRMMTRMATGQISTAHG